MSCSSDDDVLPLMQDDTGSSKLQAASGWPATREEGLRRLTEFASRAGTRYAAERNYDLGPDDRQNVSVISPYIRVRLVTEDEAVSAALAANRFEDAASFIQEVCWRTYWKGWLEMRPAVWGRYVADVAAHNARADADVELSSRLYAAKNGATGIDCFDAWAQELIETGYLHNHARMWFASIWIYTLKLPWQLGADHFMRHLLDGDPASNTLSWRWTCGLHTQGKTYLARARNISEFTGGRFPAAKGLAETAVPLTEASPVEAAAPLRLRTPAPQGRVALVVTAEDLSPETLPFGDATIDAVIFATFEDAGVSKRVKTFRASALDDALQRSEKHFQRKPVVIDVGERNAVLRIEQAVAGRPVVMAQAPVGPARTALAPVQSELAAKGAVFYPLRRDWDDAFWPHAGRGFFQLKDKIPETLRSLGIAV